MDVDNEKIWPYVSYGAIEWLVGLVRWITAGSYDELVELADLRHDECDF